MEEESRREARRAFERWCLDNKLSSYDTGVTWEAFLFARESAAAFAVQALKDRIGYYYQRDVPHQRDLPKCMCRGCIDARVAQAIETPSAPPPREVTIDPRAIAVVRPACGICSFFLACRGEDFLDGDDYDYTGRVFHPACREFELSESIAAVVIGKPS